MQIIFFSFFSCSFESMCFLRWVTSKKFVSISDLQLLSWVIVFEKLRCMGAVYCCLYVFACWLVGLFVFCLL